MTRYDTKIILSIFFAILWRFWQKKSFKSVHWVRRTDENKIVFWCGAVLWYSGVMWFGYYLDSAFGSVCLC